MSILRLTFEMIVPDTKLEQAKQIVKLETAVTEFRKKLGDHSYTDAIVSPRGPRPAKAATPTINDGEEREAAE